MHYLHIIPPTSANSMYYLLKVFHQNLDLSKHSFIVTSSRNGVIKFCPKLLAFTDLQYLSEPRKKGRDFKRISEFRKVLKQADHIIWHSFSMQSKKFMLPLYFDKELRQKSVWIRWGGEVAAEPAKSKKLRDRILANMYAKIKADIKLMGFMSEVELYRFNKRNSSNTEIRTFDTPMFISNERMLELDTLQKDSGVDERVHVQATDGGSKAHGPITTMNLLKNFCDENIIVTVPMNYGLFYKKPVPAQRKYIEKIKAHAKQVFKNKAIVLNKWVPENQYMHYLNQVDISVATIDIPSRYTNLIYMLYLGKKIYYPSKSTTYQFLQSKDIDVYDANTIPDMSMEDFIAPPNAENGIQWAKNCMCDMENLKKWQAFFDELDQKNDLRV